MVKNLDTGEVVTLKVAQEQISQGINPLSLHLMHRTSEFVRCSINLHGVHYLDNCFIVILVHLWRSYLLVVLPSCLTLMLT